MIPIQAFPLKIFPYAGGNTPQVIGYGAMSVNYGAQGEISYTLDYELPPLDQGITWAGITMQFPEPTNLSGFASLKIAIKYSNVDAHCEVKFVDKSDNTATFLLGDISRTNTGVVVQVDGDKQVITIPLHKNFDIINLEQVKEFGFAVNSNLGTGKHYFIISEIQFLK